MDSDNSGRVPPQFKQMSSLNDMVEVPLTELQKQFSKDKLPFYDAMFKHNSLSNQQQKMQFV